MRLLWLLMVEFFQTLLQMLLVTSVVLRFLNQHLLHYCYLVYWVVLLRWM